MIEAALALVLTGQRIGVSAAGAPPPLLHFEISDMTTRVTTYFGVHRGRSGNSNAYRIDRSVRRGETHGGRDSLRLDECPAIRPLLEQATRLPLPSPALARMTVLDLDGPRTLTWYRISGSTLTGSGELGHLEMTAVERRGARPSALAQWMLSVADAYQACLDRRGPLAPAEEGSAEDD